MATAVSDAPAGGPLRLLPRMTSDMERRFGADYYQRIRPTLRVMAPLLAVLFAACTVRDFADTGSLGVALAQDGIPVAFFLAVFALAWTAGLGRIWQPVLAATGLATAIASLGALATFMAGSGAGHAWGMRGHRDAFSGSGQFLGQQVCLLMVCLAALRLRFRWALPLQFAVFGASIWAFGARLHTAPVTAMDLSHFLRPAAAILAAVLLAALIGEQQAVRVFIAERLLEQERDDERRLREQTEGQLRVLARAIGTIVHDQGNPLTAVQLGTDLLEMRADTADPGTIRRINESIQEGAQMLGALRLSLIEQTRALEGKPIPVDLRGEPLRPLVEAGARFQSGRLTSGRVVSREGEDMEVYADRLKLITVLMNLIGNALKYSDGEVRVIWQHRGDMALIAVQDRGRIGRGICEAQATQLFTPFGRLDAHAEIEGTGLGLVSARKIVEAHGGTVFIEGHVDGTAASFPFSTARGRYPSMLTSGFLTAFVIACPAPCRRDATRIEATPVALASASR